MSYSAQRYVTTVAVALSCVLVDATVSAEERRIILYTQTPGDFLPDNNPLQPGTPPEYKHYIAPLTGVEQIPADATIKLVRIWSRHRNVIVATNEHGHSSKTRHLMFYTDGTTKFNPEDWYWGEPLEEHYNLTLHYDWFEGGYGPQDWLNRLTNQPWTIQDLETIQVGFYLKWPAPLAGLPPSYDTR